MKKRFLALLVCVLLLAMVIPGVANAQGNSTAPVAAVSYKVARYSNAQFAALFEGVDWRMVRPERARRPLAAG